MRFTLEADGKDYFIDVIKSRQGTPLYEIRVDPDHAVGNKVVGWELGVYRITRKGVGQDNLLAPIRNWHGLQAFHFNALDLGSPPDKSIFGRVRIFHLPPFTLVAVVESFELVPSGDAFRTLALYIEAK